MSSVLQADGPGWQDLSWGGVTEQAGHEEPQALMASALQGHMMLYLIPLALPFTHPGAVDKQAAKLGCTFNPCCLSFGATLQGES